MFTVTIVVCDGCVRWLSRKPVSFKLFIGRLASTLTNMNDFNVLSDSTDVLASKEGSPNLVLESDACVLIYNK